MADRTFAVVVGTRPNFVKAAAFFEEARKHRDIAFTLIHTGQHFDNNMSKIFFDEMKIPKPDVLLPMRGETHTERIGSMFNSLMSFIAPRSNEFRGVIVFGDVNSTLAGALAASRARIPITHIEAGLRSNDRRMPEEINRVIVDHLSDTLMISEDAARLNLEREGITKGVIPVGSLMIESLEMFREIASKYSVRTSLGLTNNPYIVATIHRVENTDDPAMLTNILHALAELAKRHVVVFPLHPGTRNRIREYGIESYLNGLEVVDPLGYFEFLDLMLNSEGIVTDSGGIQEETSHLGIPCCTLRDNTERPITIEQGSNKLFPPGLLDESALKAMDSHLSRTNFSKGAIPLWDNKVSQRIFEHL